MSSTTTASLVSINVMDLSSISPRTRTSPARVSKRRMFNNPVITTAPFSIEVTRVIGTKIRLRSGTSTTSPRILGGSLFVLRVATASRTFPTGSPFGSKTAVPARRARNTRFRRLLLMG